MNEETKALTEEQLILARTSEYSLYGLEAELLALLDTEDLVTDPNQRAEIEREIIAVRCAVVEKRDRVAGLIRHCKQTQSAIAEERNRLATLAAHYEAVEERVKGYVAEVIRAAGKDSKGKYKPLEGRTLVMRLQASGGVQSLEIVQENAIPTHLGKFHGVIGEQHYRRLRELCGDDPNTLAELDRMTWHVDTGSVRAILEGGAEVPGARLLHRGESVVVK